MNDNRRNPNWEQIEKWMGGRLPFMTDKWKKQIGAGGTDWVSEYVDEVLKRSFADRLTAPWEGQSATTSSSSADDESLQYEYDVLETHTSFIVRVKLPSQVQVRNVRVYASAMQLKLEQDPRRRRMHIALPAAIDSALVKAAFKDQVLEVRCPRMGEAELYQEVRIRFL